jgi:hypothetical protein
MEKKECLDKAQLHNSQLYIHTQREFMHTELYSIWPVWLLYQETLKSILVHYAGNGKARGP